MDISKLGITPGPWRWYGWFAKGRRNTMDLATTHSGRLYIMDFVRAGTQGALPRFRKRLDIDHTIMERCDQFGEKMDHNGEYTMTEPNAMVIAAAPEMLEWLIHDLYIQDVMETTNPGASMEKIRSRYGEEVAVHLLTMYDKQKALVEKATGLPWDEVKEKINE